MIEGRVAMLDRNTWTSLTRAVGTLNAGGLTLDDGFGIIFSKSRHVHFLIWRSDKRSEALALLQECWKTCSAETGHAELFQNAANPTAVPLPVLSRDAERILAEVVPAHPSGAAEHGGAWSTERCVVIGHGGGDLDKLLEGDAEVLLLGRARWNSVKDVVAALETGTLAALGGLCVVFSKSMVAYCLLWRQDKESELANLFPFLSERDLSCGSEPCGNVIATNGASPKRSDNASRMGTSSSSHRKQAHVEIPREGSYSADLAIEAPGERPTPRDLDSACPLKPIELHFTNRFDLMQPTLQSQLLSKLSLAPGSTVEELTRPGGLNLGVWALHDASKDPAKSWVVKLVHSERVEGEKFIRLSHEVPAVMEDATLAFPVKIVHCIGDCGSKQYDLIVMPKLSGSSLGDVMGTLWWSGQAAELMRILGKVGTRLAKFHKKYENYQHCDFQPSNIYYDQNEDTVTLIDLADIGPEGTVADNDVGHFLEALKLVSKAYGPKFLQDAKKHFLAGYAACTH